MTELKFFSISLALPASFPSLHFTNKCSKKADDKRDSSRSYTCLGCNKLVFVCSRCDRGNIYCFDGCAITEPKRLNRARSRRHTQKPSIKVKRAAYMRKRYRQLKMGTLSNTTPSDINSSHITTSTNLDLFLAPADLTYQQKFTILPERHHFNPLKISPLTIPCINFLTDDGSTKLSFNGLIASSNHDTDVVLTKDPVKPALNNLVYQVCACCRRALPKWSRPGFHIKILESKKN